MIAGQAIVTIEKGIAIEQQESACLSAAAVGEGQHEQNESEITDENHHGNDNNNDDDDEDNFKVCLKSVDAVNSPLGTFEIELGCNYGESNVDENESQPILTHPLDFKMLYVADPTDSSLEQVLEHIQLQPLAESGKFKFTFEVQSPDYTKIPNDQILGVTLAILKCSYRDKTFANVGFFIKNLYEDEDLLENPPDVVDLSRLRRQVVRNAKISEFNINWTGSDEYFAAKTDNNSETCQVQNNNSIAPKDVFTPHFFKTNKMEGESSSSGNEDEGNESLSQSGGENDENLNSESSTEEADEDGSMTQDSSNHGENDENVDVGKACNNNFATEPLTKQAKIAENQCSNLKDNVDNINGASEKHDPKQTLQTNNIDKPTNNSS